MDFVSLQDLLAIGRQNLVLLLGLPLACALLGLYFSLAQAPQYKASTLVQLDPKPSKFLAQNSEVYDPGYETGSYYYTQIQLIMSRKLAAKLVDKLQLHVIPEFSGNGVQPIPAFERILSLMPGLPEAPAPTPLNAEDIHDVAVRRTMAAISAEIARGTTLIRVQFSSTDPNLAAEAANALADIYVEELLQARLDIYAKATSWITEKLGDVSRDLSAAEKNLQGYRESRKLVNVGGNRALAEEELQESSRRLRDAERARNQLQNQDAEIRKLMSDPTAIADAQSLLADPLVKDAAQAFLAIRTQVKSVESRYGVRHPQYLAIKARLDETEINYSSQLQIKARGVSSELEIARSNEQQLQAAVNMARQRLQILDRDEFQLNMLERNVSSNRQLYDVFLARFNDTETSSSYNETNARIADPAVKPIAAFAPDKKKIVLVSTALGSILAFALMLLRQLLRTRLETADEIEALTSVPLIGVIPHCGDRELQKSAIQYFTNQPKAAFSDAIRSVKTALLMSFGASREVHCAVIAITSAEPNEGKTTLCSALGAALASNARVLVIDGDMRRPSLARHFGKRNLSRLGLTDFLLADLQLEDILVQDNASGLSYLPAGHQSPNPALLLESGKFADLLNQLRQNYDFILIDTPPILATSDALHLSKNVDGFLLVARAEKTHKAAFMSALKKLEVLNAHGIGIVMNDNAISRSSYLGHYYYGSNYGY